MNAYRNKFVLKIEHGHPGKSDHMVIATEESLRELANDLSKSLSTDRKSSFIHGVTCTEAHGESSNVYLTFHTAKESEIDTYHTRSSLRWLKSYFWIPIFGLAIYGAYRLFN